MLEVVGSSGRAHVEEPGAVHSTLEYTIGMTIWESGRESGLLDEIRAGRKTIEGRLAKGKFAEYRLDDVVKLRRDIRGKDGVLRDGDSDTLRVKIVGIRRYDTFLEMVQTEGYEKVIPAAQSAEEAAAEYDKYYSIEDQAQHGVLAIEIAPCISAEEWDEIYAEGDDFMRLSDADVQQLAGFVPSGTPRTALDVGCGAGRLVRQLRAVGFAAVGVDPSEQAIARARRDDADGEYVVGDITAIGGVYGVITCQLVYAFVEGKEQFLRDVAERLDPSGFFVMIAPTHDRPISKKKIVQVDRTMLLHQLRGQFRVIHKQQTKLGLLVVCRPR